MLWRSTVANAGDAVFEKTIASFFSAVQIVDVRIDDAGQYRASTMNRDIRRELAGREDALDAV